MVISKMLSPLKLKKKKTKKQFLPSSSSLFSSIVPWFHGLYGYGPRKFLSDLLWTNWLCHCKMFNTPGCGVPNRPNCFWVDPMFTLKKTRSLERLPRLQPMAQLNAGTSIKFMLKPSKFHQNDDIIQVHSIGACQFSGLHYPSKDLRWTIQFDPIGGHLVTLLEPKKSTKRRWPRLLPWPNC